MDFKIYPLYKITSSSAADTLLFYYFKTGSPLDYFVTSVVFCLSTIIWPENHIDIISI